MNKLALGASGVTMLLDIVSCNTVRTVSVVRADPSAPVPSAVQTCPQLAAGGPVVDPPSLSSVGGILAATLTYSSSVGPDGLTRFCYVLADGRTSPALHVRPGDHLHLTLVNGTTVAASTSAMAMTVAPANVCGAAAMTSASTNLHFHGLNFPEACHQDEVVFTLVNTGESFDYDVNIPAHTTPGLYWYHPHVHGLSEEAVQGGASGALIIDGIQNTRPDLVGLPERLLVLRDQLNPSSPTPSATVPSWDLTVNSVPILFPTSAPAQLQIQPKTVEFWRVLNAAADAIMDLRLTYDGVAQPLRVVALDGIPVANTGDQTRTDVLLPPGARAELIVTSPDTTVAKATFDTLGIDTGPAGDSDPQRTLIDLIPNPAAPVPNAVPASDGAAVPATDLASIVPNASRKLYFSEVFSIPGNPASPTNFFITEDGATPKLFGMSNPPALSTTSGNVEDWVVENRSTEVHVFHIHQTHFMLLERNGVAVGPADAQVLDTVQLPYWTGTGPFPSVKLRLDFRNVSPGNVPFHCHILEHEDSGMMAILRVLPAAPASR